MGLVRWCATQKSFSKIRMAQVKSEELKKLAKLCAGRVPVLHLPSLYRAHMLTFPAYVTVPSTGSLGQSVGILRLIRNMLPLNAVGFRWGWADMPVISITLALRKRFCKPSTIVLFMGLCRQVDNLYHSRSAHVLRSHVCV